MASPHFVRVSAVGTVQFCQCPRKFLQRDGRLAPADRTHYVLRELAGRTVNTVFFEEFAGLRHHAGWRVQYREG